MRSRRMWPTKAVAYERELGQAEDGEQDNGKVSDECMGKEDGGFVAAVEVGPGEWLVD